MPTAYLTRIVEFTASHRLPHDHSHRYQCRVTVTGALSPSQGGIVNLATLDDLLQREVVARLDGRHINNDVPEFHDGRWIPTGEALAVYIWERLAAALPAGVRLHAVRVQESDHLYSEYFGEA
ncbi:MAG TPA: 6-carboxytetrahydropterin synthase [Gemmatimonadales bacterium]|jgi:6-pyruvoyltetrahydropterin/6-carboxytetrahydropterin synthase|nr:6-carboxytetrahydropterin synthase [Gemmatimonadales bacterium]